MQHFTELPHVIGMRQMGPCPRIKEAMGTQAAKTARYTKEKAALKLRNETFMTHAMDAWADTVYRVALSHTRSVHDAEDVVQDVFLRLLKSGTRFADDEHLKAWLLSVTVNRCREVQRAAWFRREVPQSPLGDDGLAYDTEQRGLWRADARGNIQGAPHHLQGPGAETLPTAPSQTQTVPGPEEAYLFAHPLWEAMGRLSEDMRTAVHLHYVEGYSTDEIARIMDSKPATVRSWLHRARKQLKLDLESSTPATTKQTQAPTAQTRTGEGRCNPRPNISLPPIPDAGNTARISQAARP